MTRKPSTKRPLKGQLSEAFSRTIREYLLIEQTELCPADLVLVFGNKYISETLAQKAAALYHAGHAPLILASGGKALEPNGPTEAEVIGKLLREMNVPDHAIILETKAMITPQNIKLAKALLKERGELDQVKRVIGVGHITAARRFLMTLERQWPEVLKMLVSANPYPVPVDQHHLHDGFRREAMRQFSKLDYYFRKNQIMEIDLVRLNETIRLARDQSERSINSAASEIAGRGGPLPGSGPA